MHRYSKTQLRKGKAAAMKRPTPPACADATETRAEEEFILYGDVAAAALPLVDGDPERSPPNEPPG